MEGQGEREINDSKKEDTKETSTEGRRRPPGHCGPHGWHSRWQDRLGARDRRGKGIRARWPAETEARKKSSSEVWLSAAQDEGREKAGPEGGVMASSEVQRPRALRQRGDMSVLAASYQSRRVQQTCDGLPKGLRCGPYSDEVHRLLLRELLPGL
jgi:hypothetical protein